MSTRTTAARTRRGWIIPSAVASVAVAASLGLGTFGAYTASITNDGNTAGTGILTMSETGPGIDGADVTYDTADGEGNAIVATDINKYGGADAMVPGDSVTTTVTFTNTGNVEATAFELAIGEAIVTPAGAAVSLADALQITFADAEGIIYFRGTPNQFAELGTLDLSTLAMAPNETVDFTFTVTLPASQDDPALMGQQVSQELVWNLSAAADAAPAA